MDYKLQKLPVSVYVYPGSRQKGVVLILVTVGMLAILGMAGLALDMGRVYQNNTRLQNALDAAALSGAKTLNGGANVLDSKADALATFNLHLEGDLLAASPVPTIEFSETLSPFTSGATEPNARYIRAKFASMPVPTGLTSLLPGIGPSLPVGGSAVAGPIPIGTEICDLAPVLVCGDTTDTDCSDGSCFGYNIENEEEYILKLSTNDSEIGPGNFQLVDFGSGGDDVREGLAGGADTCATGGVIITEPGNTVGPVIQGFNTRFGDYAAGMSEVDFPPDVIIQPGSYADYLNLASSGSLDNLAIPDGPGAWDRRILAVPITDCTGIHTGKTDLPLLGIGCFFMTQKVLPINEEHGGEIFGEFIGDCHADGDVAENPGTAIGSMTILEKIVLYKDPDNVDS